MHPPLATTPSAGRRWIDVDGARVRKGLHELTDPALVVALDDHVEGMLAVNDRGADEPPPILGRWSRLYALVIAELALVIAFCGWLSRLR